MRLPELPSTAALGELPLWPPLLAVRGKGSRSELHAHHAMHVILALDGELRLRSSPGASWQLAPGVLTAPDQPHAVDASDREVLLVFFDPETELGMALARTLSAPIRALSQAERAALAADADPATMMRDRGEAWAQAAARALGASPAATRRLHPAIRRLLGEIRAGRIGGKVSLEELAGVAGLSPGRLMHVFTESIGVPLRPYLAWLKLQRAAAAITRGMPLSTAAHAAGFADVAHMSRTFKRMFGVAPSALRPGA